MSCGRFSAASLGTSGKPATEELPRHRKYSRRKREVWPGRFSAAARGETRLEEKKTGKLIDDTTAPRSVTAVKGEKGQSLG